MWKVYKRTCPNGRVYIGITSRTLEERMTGGYMNNREFALAIIEYGKDNIESVVLEEYEDYDTAHERELYYIQQYKDICYNVLGNRRGRFAQSSLHNRVSTEYIPPQCTYKDHIIPLTTKPKGWHTCPINVYDLNGTFICTYPSAKIAAKELSVNHGDIISCCKGVKSDGKPRYQVKGYVFRYAIDKLDKYPNIPVACKKVEQYTIDGEYIRTFQSLNDAWLHTGTYADSISRTCKGFRESAGGYIWKYAQ